MTLRRSDWLDRLALRSLPRPVREPRGYEPALHPEAHFSRGTAVKLALAGAVSLSFGLWKPAPVLAQDPEAGFAQCLKEHDRGLAERIQACHLVLTPRVLWRTYPSTWGRVRGALLGGERDIILAGTALSGFCILKAHYRMELFKRDCYEEAEKDCRQRSVQSSSGRSAATCEVTPPPDAPPPTIPPLPPHQKSEACVNCEIRGGKCCYGPDPLRLCACATASVVEREGCKRYGCG